jgi:hypothetical protein
MMPMFAGKRDLVGGCPPFAQKLALRANNVIVLPLIEECARWKNVECLSSLSSFPPITPEWILSVVSSLREKKQQNARKSCATRPHLKSCKSAAVLGRKCEGT